MKAITFRASWINECFAGQSHQNDVLIALYRLLYRRIWDSIGFLDGWPKAGVEVHQYIGECFTRFDKAFHPDVLSGGLWMNQGWSCDQDLGPWEVVRAPYTLEGEQ